MTGSFLEALLPSVEIIGQMAVLVLIGYVIVRRKWIGAETLTDLTRILIDIVIPSAFILAMTRTFSIELFRQGLLLAAVATAWMAGSWLTGVAWFRVFPCGSSSRRRSVQAMMMVPNSIYLPLPVILAVTPVALRDQATLYISIAALPSMVLMWTAGVLLLGGASRPSAGERLKLMLNAPIISVFVGILLTFVPGIREAARGEPGSLLPLRMLFSVMTYLSLILSPLAMLILGGMIASRGEDRSTPARYLVPLITVRLLLVPAAVYLLIRSGVLGLPALACTVLLLVAAAPPATNHALIARRYGGEWGLVSSLQLIVHLVALLTLPLWLALALPGLSR